MPERPPPPEECAHCGTAIPRGARACPECGADDRTGWRENDETRYDGLDLPDSAYEDDSAPPRSTAPRSGVRWYWLLIAAALIASLVLGLVRFR